MNVPFVDLAWQEQQIRAERERRFADVIHRTAFIGGSEIDDFEAHFAEYCGARHAIAVANGTDALALIYAAHDIGAGDEVITIPTTFIASVSPLIHRGAKPVFVDIDEGTRNFDLASLENAITNRTKAILVVHLYGSVPNMSAIAEIAEKRGLSIIEDACQAHGASYNGQKAGSFGYAAAFSFYPGKNLGAYGDGGAVTTQSDHVADKIRMLRNHGGARKYEHAIAGFNSRLDTLQAVVLDEKLKKLNSWNEMRRAIANTYQTGLSGIKELRLPPDPQLSEQVYHLYVIEILKGDRGAFMEALKNKGIATGIHYPSALHRTPALGSLGYKGGDFPRAEQYVSRIVSLPMFPGMTEDQAQYVVSTVKQYFS
jgi:dTDP-4-amino-4,6-dideoxygalactose transaminase